MLIEDSVAAGEDHLAGWRIAEADTGGKVVLVRMNQRPGVPVAAFRREVPAAVGRREDRQSILMVEHRGKQFIANAVIDGQMLTYAPAILGEKAVALFVVVDDSRCGE